MTAEFDGADVQFVDKLVINCNDQIAEKESVGHGLPRVESVGLTDSRIKIPKADIDIPYSSIRHFETIETWKGRKHESSTFWRNRYEATKTTHWRFILEKRAYFTLSKRNSAVEKAMRPGAVNVETPEISTEQRDRILDAVQNGKTRQRTYVPIDYLGPDGELRVEGWTQGASQLHADVNATAKYAGLRSSVSGEVEGTLSDNTYTTPISSFLVFEDKLIIDSKLRLELFYDDIDRVVATDEGLVIEVGQTTYRIKTVGDCVDERGYQRRGKEETKSMAEISNYIVERVGSESNHNTNQSANIPERLEELKRLHDEGLITDGDFETKKQELLDQL